MQSDFFKRFSAVFCHVIMNRNFFIALGHLFKIFALFEIYVSLSGQGACTDSVEGCMFWKQIGMCNIPFYQSYIMETCALTCNLC